MEFSYPKLVTVSTDELTLKEVIAVARCKARVLLAEDVKAGIQKSRAAVDLMLRERRIVYGITTGFGGNSDKVISPEESKELQRNLIESHACGVGDPLPEDVVRAMLLLRIKSLSQGFSGVRLVLLEALVDMLNKNVVPIIPEKGSLGASGDLCPLSHMVLPLLGKGEAIFAGERLEGKEAMARAGIEIIELEAKEGLSLNNGTQCMTAIGALAIHDALHLLEAAELAGAMTLEALNGREDAFDPRIQELRRQEGQKISACRMRGNIAGSAFLSRSQPGREHVRVQDAYSLRCIPQVHGASRDAINYVRGVIEREINAVTDNPLIFPDAHFDAHSDARFDTHSDTHIEDTVTISCGNFHGQPVALAMDFLGIALAELANISERRLERMVNKYISNNLPAYLVAGEGGLHSGFMIVQYSAAALVSENKVLTHPASVDSIPSSNNQEDHVSMGTIAARKAVEILENTRQVIAMELLAAAQAVDLRRMKPDWGDLANPAWLGEEDPAKLHLGSATQPCYEKIRTRVPPMLEDRVIAPDIAAVADLIKEEALTGSFHI